MTGEQTARVGVWCKVGVASLKLPNADASVLDAWTASGLVDGEPVPASVMTQALAENGHPVGETTVKAHRRHACACFK